MGIGPTASLLATGPRPKPRWLPLPQLQYAQVIKQIRRRRLVAVSSRVVFGTLAGVKQILALRGWRINTAFNRARQPHHPPACGGSRPAGHDSMQRRGRLTSTARSVSGVLQFPVCHMPAYACPYHSPKRRKGQARRNAGTRVRRRWPRG